MSTATFHLPAAGTYPLQSFGGAVLSNVTINTGASGGTLALYDAVNGATNPIGNVSAAAPVGLTYNVGLKNGLTAVVTGAADVTITVSSPLVTGTAAPAGGTGALKLPLGISAGGTGSAGSALAGYAPLAASPSTSTWYGADAIGPWIFPVTAYGAKGDGQISLTGATNGTATVTIGEAVLNQGHVGCVVMVKNALQDRSTAGQTTSVGTITVVNSPTSFTATWNTTPTRTVSGLQVLWAHDDTAAIQQAINKAGAYAALYGHAEVFFPIGTGLFYGVGGALLNTDGTNAVYNSQLTVPVNAEQNNGANLVFCGVRGSGGNTRYWSQNTPVFSGSTIVSFGCFTSQGAQATSVTNGGNPSVIGGPTGKFGYGNGTPQPLYTNTRLVVQDLSIVTTHSNSGWTYTPVNAYGVARLHARNLGYGTTGVVEIYNGNNGDFTNVDLLASGISMGLITPSNGNNDDVLLENVCCNGGYTYAMTPFEHTVGRNVKLLYSWSGLCPAGDYNDGGTTEVGALHSMWFDQLSIEACSWHLNVIGAGQSGVGPVVNAVIDTEGLIQLRDTIAGSGNNGTGLAAARGTITLTGAVSSITVSVGAGSGASGGTGLTIIQGQKQFGPATPIALTANTAVMNSYWKAATVYLTGGAGMTTVLTSNLAGGPGGASLPTMTQIMNLTTAASGGLTAPLPIRLKPGQWIQVNGATPTTTWDLD